MPMDSPWPLGFAWRHLGGVPPNPTIRNDFGIEFEEECYIVLVGEGEVCGDTPSDVHLWKTTVETGAQM